MGPGVADDDETAVVANESGEVLVGQELGKALEDFRFLRVVEMRLDFAARLGPELPHERVQRREHVEEVARLRRLVEDRLEERLAAVLDGRSRVGDDENAERRSGDDNEFVWLDQHLEVAPERRIAAEDASDGDDETDAEIQDSLPGAERSAKLCRSR